MFGTLPHTRDQGDEAKSTEVDLRFIEKRFNVNELAFDEEPRRCFRGDIGVEA
jgi:hypothetical protein